MFDVEYQLVLGYLGESGRGLGLRCAGNIFRLPGLSGSLLKLALANE